MQSDKVFLSPLINCFAKTCLVLGLLSLLLSPNAFAQETEKQRLQKIQREMDAAKETRDKLNEQAQTTMTEIAAIQAELIVQARQVQDKESSLDRISEDIGILETETKREETDLIKKQVGMAQTLSSLERLSERPPSLLLTRPQKGIDTLRSAKLLAATLPEIKVAADEIIRDITALKAARLKLRGEKDKQSSLLASLVDDRHVLDDFLKRRKTKRSLLIADAAAQDRRIQKLAKEAKDLSSLITKIEEDRVAQELAREKAAKEAADRLSAGETKPTTNDPAGRTPSPRKPITLNTPSPGSKTFRQAKGAMPRPARGRITQTFGSQLAAERAKGVRVQTRFGAQVIAPHDGTIVFSGQFRDYGNMVIIAHGNGYHSLFAGLNSDNTDVGQWVLAGEPIGIMPEKLSTTGTINVQNGQTGKPAGPSLYIEFRRNNKPFNPLAWLKKQRRKITG